MTLSLQGRVLTQTGTPVEGASVQLIGSEGPLGDVGSAAIDRPGAVTWTRTITGFAGHRWNCWQEFVMNVVSGITWEEFKVQVVEHNPALLADGNAFTADKTYTLPEQATVQPVVAWTRSITGFSGNRWNCWTACVQGKVDGITWDEFVQAVLDHNLALAADGNVFMADKTYLPPGFQPLTALVGNHGVMHALGGIHADPTHHSLLLWPLTGPRRRSFEQS